MDLIDEGPGGAPDNAPELSVSEISGAVKRVIEGEFAYVRVRGEVGRVSRPRSGHVYLDLKDATIADVAQRIQDRGMQQQVVWCVSPPQVAEIRRSCPECIPMPDPESEESLPNMLLETTPKIVAPVWSDFSSTFSAKCHQAGALVFVDEQKPDPENWQQALDWGVDGIQTDAPELLIEFLRNRP